MRLHVLQLYFLTFNHYIWSTDGIDIEELQDIITGVSVLDDKGSSIDIDDDHKQSNPECGYLPEEPKDQSACSRISNAEETNMHYPWVISVTRQHLYDTTDTMSDTRRCGGSIITKNTAVTAGHCICKSFHY